MCDSSQTANHSANWYTGECKTELYCARDRHRIEHCTNHNRNRCRPKCTFKIFCYLFCIHVFMFYDDLAGFRSGDQAEMYIP